MLHTTTVNCPQLVCAGCGGQPVTATYKATTVEVGACEPLLAQGWTGPAVVLWHNQALDLLTPVSTAVQHRDGLMVLR